jgi:hypothetical protein
MAMGIACLVAQTLHSPTATMWLRLETRQGDGIPEQFYPIYNTVYQWSQPMFRSIRDTLPGSLHISVFKNRLIINSLGNEGRALDVEPHGCMMRVCDPVQHMKKWIFQMNCGHREQTPPQHESSKAEEIIAPFHAEIRPFSVAQVVTPCLSQHSLE